MTKVKLATFYTNCVLGGNYLNYRGVENGKRISKRIPYQPTLFVPSNKPSTFKTMDGFFVEPIKHDSMKSARDFLERYKDVENFKVYGNTYYNYCYLLEQYPDHVDYDSSMISIANIDIETDTTNGFASPETASAPIISITIKLNDKIEVFGYGDYKVHLNNITYHKSRDEIDMLEKFVRFWVANYPDVVTGWNISGYDIPFIYNRLLRVFGEDVAKKLSPWGWITKRTVILMGRQQETIALSGISLLDYLELYKKHAPDKNRESYKLDFIAHVELGERKLDYGEYGSLKKLHSENYQKFIEYNVQDVLLVEKIDSKLKLLDMVFDMAYNARVNYDDILGQIKAWDTIIFRELLKTKTVVPLRKDDIEDQSYEGAFVKEPIAGMHRWVASLDVASLYPSIIQMCNISPETITNEFKSIDIEKLVVSPEQIGSLKDKPLIMAANGCTFKKDYVGVLPQIIKKMYNERKEFKQKKIQAEKDLELVRAELNHRGIKYE